MIKLPKLNRVAPSLRSRDDVLRRPLGEWLLLLMLAALQFTVAVDFVIMMPLGPQLMRIFEINTPAFNLAVAAQTIPRIQLLGASARCPNFATS